MLKEVQACGPKGGPLYLFILQGLFFFLRKKHVICYLSIVQGI